MSEKLYTNWVTAAAAVYYLEVTYEQLFRWTTDGIITAYKRPSKEVIFSVAEIQNALKGDFEAATLLL